MRGVDGDRDGGTPLSLLHATPWSVLGSLAAALALAALLVRRELVSETVLGVTTIVAGHGAMLGTAIAWSVGGDARRRARYSLVVVALIALAATAEALSHAAWAYLVIPIWLARQAAKHRLVVLGLGTPNSATGVAVGACAGAFLGTHMLVTAMLTFGYRPLEQGLGAALPGFAYDAGVQVPATACFFYGGLFNRAQRRWPFLAACAVATGASVARYVVDPLLPSAVELVAGAVFYTTLLGIANAWLLWRFGSLVPGLIASFLFFAAYRLLGVA
jgi:hypothetical protein